MNDDIQVVKFLIQGMQEHVVEVAFNYDIADENSRWELQSQEEKIRKLNRKIGENLKRLYGYRCQICGKVIGEQYALYIAKARHIDYFVHSLNNDANNHMIVCPNHHSIIHDADPIFDRKRIVYRFGNGMEEKLMLNKHLTP